MRGVILLGLISSACSNSIFTLDFNAMSTGLMQPDAAKGFSWYNNYGWGDQLVIDYPSYRNTKFLRYTGECGGMHTMTTFLSGSSFLYQQPKAARMRRLPWREISARPKWDLKSGQISIFTSFLLYV